MRDSKKLNGRVAAMALIAAILLPSPAYAQFDPTPANIAAASFDVVILRPMRILETVLGAVLAVPVALIGAPNGKDGFREVWERFVSEPAKSVYQQPLGDF
jgi:hypothetical protein